MNNNVKNVMIFSLIAVIALVSLELRMPSHAQNTSDVAKSNSQDSSDAEKVIDAIRNPDFTSINSTSGLPLYWDDSFGVCGITFNCAINSTDGWYGNESFQLSTKNNTEYTWSWISSQEIVVRENEEYQVIAHMKLNEWATQSHILIEGFDDSTGEWYQLEQCPAGTDGPLEWKIFDCKITIPTNTTSMMVTLNAGWSSQVDKDAITSFDAIHAYRKI